MNCFINFFSQIDSHALNMILWLQENSSAELLTVATFLVCCVAILSLLRYFGAMGLYVYNALAIVFANIQVLKLTIFNSFSEPVALGTVLFTTTFFVNDLLTEHYGPKTAKKSIALNFWIQILMVIWVLLTLGHPVVPAISNSIEATGLVKSEFTYLIDSDLNHQAMMQLFTPSFRLLISSLIAFWCSQWIDVLIFSKLRNVTQGRFLWLRQNVSMLMAGFLDTLIFSVLAWRWLSDSPVSWFELFATFIISAQIIRVILNVAATPIMYLSYRYVRGYNGYQFI